jgi:hypothetical protein
MKKTLEIKTLKITGSKGFSVLAGINRAIVPSHVTKLASSLDKMGVIRPVVVSSFDFIDGKKTTYIIDGQHLYNALMRVGWDIPYTEIEIKNTVELAEHLALLNSSSKSWTIMDYIKVWSNVSKDYVTLNKYFNIYDIELMQLAEILKNNTCAFSGGQNNSISKFIKKGEFKVENEKEAVFTLNCVTDALKIVPRLDRMSNRLFIASFVNFMFGNSKYDHKHFMNSLKVNKDKFKLSTQDPEEFKNLLKSIS